MPSKVSATKQETKAKPPSKKLSKPKPVSLELDEDEIPSPPPKKTVVKKEQPAAKQPSKPKAKSPTAAATKKPTTAKKEVAPKKEKEAAAKPKASKSKRPAPVDLDDEPSSSPAPAEEQDRPLFPKNAFQFFSIAERPSLVESNPDMPHKERQVELSRMWKEMGDDERQPYVEQANEDRERFESDCEKLGYKPERKRKAKDGEQAPKRRRKDPNDPKGASNAYIHFGKEERPRLLADNPELKGNTTEIMRALAQRWNELSDIDKEPYVKLAAADKVRYEKEKAACMAN